MPCLTHDKRKHILTLLTHHCFPPMRLEKSPHLTTHRAGEGMRKGAHVLPTEAARGTGTGEGNLAPSVKITDACRSWHSPSPDFTLRQTSPLAQRHSVVHLGIAYNNRRLGTTKMPAVQECGNKSGQLYGGTVSSVKKRTRKPQMQRKINLSETSEV